MNRSTARFVGTVLIFQYLISAGTTLDLMAKEPSKSDQALAAKVAAKFFEVAAPVEGWAWPPLVGISEVDEVNAFAALQNLKPGAKPDLKGYSILMDNLNVVWIDVPYSAPTSSGVKNADGETKKPAETSGKAARPQPFIILLQGFLDQVVKGREVYLADTFGHELAHVLLRHTEGQADPDAPLVLFALSRQQESDADMLGMKLALQAEYPYDELIKAVQAWRTFDPAGSSIAALRRTHPGWTDRASLIDGKQAELWSTLSAFENGVYFLMAENYPLAERCFTQVVKEMPRCYEAWANRGYCRLMQYCDLLEPDDLRELELSQVVVGGFYRRAGSIETRGINVDLWFDAVGDFREALRLNESLILPKANLALAYLVHPNGKQPGKAAELFEQVIATLKEGDLEEEISPPDHAALLVNAGVTEFANGDPKTAEQFFGQALSIYENEVKSAPAGPIKSAMLYSQANQMASSSEAPVRKQAAQRFEEYLSTTNPAIAWWSLAYERYKELCAADKLNIKNPQELARPQNVQFRPVLSFDVGDGNAITLNDKVSSITEMLGEGTKIPIVRRSNIHRRKYEERGFELLCSERLIAVRLRNEKAPPLVLKASGPGGATAEIRVGMRLADLERLLKREANAWDSRYGTQQSVIYRYFSRLGFGVRIDDEGKIMEIIIAQIPYEAIAK